MHFSGSLVFLLDFRPKIKIHTSSWVKNWSWKLCWKDDAMLGANGHQKKRLIKSHTIWFRGRFLGLTTMGNTAIFQKKVVTSPTNYKNRQSRLAQKRSRLPEHDGMSPQSVAKPFLTAQFLQLSLFNNVQIQNFDCNSSESVTPPQIPFHGAENLDSDLLFEVSGRKLAQKRTPASSCSVKHWVSPHRSHGGTPLPTGPFLQHRNKTHPQNIHTIHPFKKDSVSLKQISAPHPLNLLTYITATLFLFQHDLHLQNGGRPYWHITHMC